MQVTVAAIQMSCSWDIAANLDQADALVQQAAQQGAQIILLPELFETPYFCKDQKADFFSLAKPINDNPVLRRYTELAADLKVVLPISFFERANNAYFNSVMLIDSNGQHLGCYRKTHIPDGLGYYEKYYFSPGDTDFPVWHTEYGKVGLAICWDQWFPESARIMALKGADILLYPSAIGSEPEAPELDSSGHWQRVMQGHAAANLMPLVASNRVGEEIGQTCSVTFYGSSFIADATGAMVQVASRDKTEILIADFDLAEIERQRIHWGVFRDRRPSQYAALLTLDGNHLAV